MDALTGVSLDVADGEFLTILGPSGCGKSTLLLIIGGMETPSAGRVEFEGPRRESAPLKRRPGRYGVGAEDAGGGRKRLRFPGLGPTRPVLPRLLDLAERREAMGAARVARQLLAPWMDLVGYSLPPEEGQRRSRLLNEALAEALQADGSGQFLGAATVPLQDGGRAAAELEDAVERLGLRAVQIGTNVMGSPLDQPGLEPFWTAAAARAPLIVHPWHVAGEDRLGPHGFLRLLGYPFDTTLAAGALVFGGVADRFPPLRVILVYAGGFFPYQAGRLERGHHLLEAGARRLRPMDALRCFYSDTITHWALPLRYLAEVAGSDRIMLGSDYPFDVGDPDPVASVEAADFPAPAEAAILGATARGLFGPAGTGAA